MALGIISQKINTISGVHILYQAKGVGDDWKNFVQWLQERTFKDEWCSLQWFGWRFNDPVNNVAIRLQWAEYFLYPVIIDGVGHAPPPLGITNAAKVNVYWPEMREKIIRDINAETLIASKA